MLTTLQTHERIGMAKVSEVDYTGLSVWRQPSAMSGLVEGGLGAEHGLGLE